jgi:uncharacterized membrane protein
MSDDLLPRDEDADAGTGGILKEHATRRSARLITGSVRFSGPIPPPDVLRSYQEVNPDFAERIFRMAELEQAHGHATENRQLDLVASQLKEQVTTTRRATILGFVVILAFLGVGIYTIALGYPGWGVAIVGTSLIGVLAVFLNRTPPTPVPLPDGDKDTPPALPEAAKS